MCWVPSCGGRNGERACNPSRGDNPSRARSAAVGGAEYNAAREGSGDHRDAASRTRGPRQRGRADGSRRPLGPLGGPACTRQTGYRSVLYEVSWTTAEPPRIASPPAAAHRRAATVMPCGRGRSTPQTAGLSSVVQPRRSAQTMSSGTARTRLTMRRRASLQVNALRRQSSHVTRQLRQRRVALSAARSASSRSSSYVSVVDVAHRRRDRAMARPARRSSRCISCATRRYVGMALRRAAQLAACASPRARSSAST